MIRLWVAISFITVVPQLLAQTAITVLFTNNTNGIAEICDCGTVPLGGLARRKSFFESVQKRTSAVLKLDAGDFLDAFGFNAKKDELVIQLYRELGYDAVNIGDQEFANGSEFIRQQLLRSELPLISANLGSGANPLSVESRVVITRQNLRIGVVGYLPWSSFLYFSDKTKLPVKPYGDGLDQLQKSVDDLRPQVDLLIVLSQAGFENDVEWTEKIHGVDVVIGGHSQTELTAPYRQAETVIVQAGSGGTHVGKLDLVLRNKQWTVSDYRLVPLDSTIPEDTKFRLAIDRFEKQKVKK